MTNSSSPEVIDRSAASDPSLGLISLLSKKVVGQSAATKAIVPYVYMYQSGLAPQGRPAGVFLLLGPTGTGKTKTVEAIADSDQDTNGEANGGGSGFTRNRSTKNHGRSSLKIAVHPRGGNRAKGDAVSGASTASFFYFYQ